MAVEHCPPSAWNRVRHRVEYAFKQGDRYILRPETGMTIRPTVLPNGERAFILGAEQ